MNIPEFATKKELYSFLVTNKESLMAQKKAELKRADILSFPASIMLKDADTNKAEGQQLSDPNTLIATVVINTTNLFDSHRDVHLPGLWDKSLKENKGLMHLQEHVMAFANIISDGSDLKSYTKQFGWAELGYNYPGNTEALVFESTIKKDRNLFMFDQYKKGYVRNHSVGMQYVKLILCINDEDCGAEYEAWQKYYPEVANKSDVDEIGYFWAVKEAKVVEGSAVPRGSNWATPTISISEGKSKPVNATSKEEEPINFTLFKNVSKDVSFRKLTICDKCGTWFDSYGMEPDDEGEIICKACGGKTKKETKSEPETIDLTNFKIF